MKLRFWKIGLCVAIATASICLFGCSSNQEQEQEQPPQEEQVQQEEPEKEVTKYKVGDTVETDIVEFTLNSAELAIALNSSMAIGANAPAPIETDYCLPKEYNSEEDAGKAYVASKGHTLVSVVYTVKNLDRARISLEAGTDTSLSSNDVLGTIEYSGETFEFGTENREYGLVVDDEGHWLMGSENSAILSLEAGQTKECRAYVDIPIDAASLDDSFEITFNLPQSDGTTSAFTFVK